jgi:hypothetical protein
MACLDITVIIGVCFKHSQWHRVRMRDALCDLTVHAAAETETLIRLFFPSYTCVYFDVQVVGCISYYSDCRKCIFG